MIEQSVAVDKLHNVRSFAVLKIVSIVSMFAHAFVFWAVFFFCRFSSECAELLCVCVLMLIIRAACDKQFKPNKLSNINWFAFWISFMKMFIHQYQHKNRDAKATWWMLECVLQHFEYSVSREIHIHSHPGCLIWIYMALFLCKPHFICYYFIFCTKFTFYFAKLQSNN